MNSNQPSERDIVASMPKVELHAHLNGSISDELLQHLKIFGENDRNIPGDEFPGLDAPGVLMPAKLSNAEIHEDSNRMRSLKECWEAFGRIHEVIRTPRILYVATVNVIADFSRDNVIYLEIRTGPKRIHNIPSKLSYLETVVEAIKAGQKLFPISVKLLISIDRKNGEEEAQETVKLASDMVKKYPGIVVGIDVSGDPRCGHFSWIVRVMQEARRLGLKISCHLPEIVNPDEGLAFLEFGPERVGHGQFLHPLYGGTEELWELAKRKRIPLECCISSNLVSGVTASVDTHIVKILHAESLPFIICTDDSGVFKTTLSTEFKKLLSIVPLKSGQLQDLSLDAINYSFASEEEKLALKKLVKEWW